LLHLIRNAFDHGIEDPATRLAQGKLAQGVIEILAGHRGNQTVITIQDDGAGINFDRIRAKALQMGFTGSDLAAASEQDLLDLIFEPGFSTAEQVSDLSGRGVGMDVVRTHLEQIGGQIQVETRRHLGTLFTITVPRSLSVLRILLVDCQGLLLAFPTSVVEEMVILKDLTLHPTAAEPYQQTFPWQGYQVPLIPLAQWLRLARPLHRSPAEESPIIDQATVLVVGQADRPFGLQVDRYWRELEVTIRPVEGWLPLPAGFSSCSILGDGRVVPLIDTAALLTWIEGQNSPGSVLWQPPFLFGQDLSPTGSPRLPLQETVMIVDDSINVRRFLALTLEKAGFQVEQAKDGQEALEQLRSGVSVQAVICDIEMPRLDGFGFLAQVKADPTHRHLPVVMLTSRSGDKHRQLAMSLGATAYFSKPFKEQELLQTLKQLTQHSALSITR
jgi:chemosensory pili system protein ChpA (sensor histidine kinase/response regulator)